MNKIPYYANCNVERTGGGGIPCALGDTIKQSKPNMIRDKLNIPWELVFEGS